MNYRRIYDELTGRARERGSVDGYSERHHITPRSHGGSDDPENLAVLTAREHFVAHWLLWRIHRSPAMAFAFNIMRYSTGNDRYYNARAYQEASKANAWAARIRETGKTASEETKRKRSAALTGHVVSEETREKLRKANKGQVVTAEQRAKISAAKTGRKVPASVRKKMSESHKNQERVSCPHCQKVGAIGAMKRWHFKNCRHRATQINEVNK